MILPARIIGSLQMAVALAQLLRFAQGVDSSLFKDPHYVEGRTVMVQMFEWKFKDIAEECERFLGPIGYGGLQVSPISENAIIKGRPWYERYQPISYKIISRSGDEDDFKDMVSRCNAVGVRVFVDLVSNHMTTDLDPAVGTGGTTAKPADLEYPAVPYGPEHFHAACPITNYGNAVEVRNCSLNGLHDLDQGKDYVRDKIVEFANRIIDHGIAGFRIDAAKHMWPNDLKVIYSKMKNLREDIFGKDVYPFIYQEVIDLGNSEGSSKWDYNSLAMVIEFIYGGFVGGNFRGWGPLKDLENLESPTRDLMTSSDALVMIDNHDNQRQPDPSPILNYKTAKLYKMAVAFMLAHPYGKARVMSSFSFSDIDQGPPADANDNILSPVPVSSNVTAGEIADDCGNGWVCEHRWSEIYGMVNFRNIVQNVPILNWWAKDDKQIAFSRGSLGFVAFNGLPDADLKENLTTGLPAGEYCDIISGRKVGGKCTGKSAKVNDDSTAYIEILKDELDGVLAIHAKTKL